MKHATRRGWMAGVAVLVGGLWAVAEEAPARPQEFDLDQVVQRNPYSFVPPQCYTKTVDAAGKVHNPCHSCHVDSRSPNFIEDAEIQLSYDFAPKARVNLWANLFVDWTQAAEDISTDAILRYVRQSNYFDDRGEIRLRSRLASLPKDWDVTDDGNWGGFVPDARFRFDEEGFDRLPDAGYTGWRAYAYYPVPGTFWPTNGSIGDALVRLPAAFRENEAGAFDPRIYKLNLSIVESLILRRNVAIEATDEKALGVDLDLDGALGRVRGVRFVAPSSAPLQMGFVGRARVEQAAGRVHLAPGLFPEGTEFLHSVRYLDPAGKSVRMAPRMKELRYARKAEWLTEERLDKRARSEAEEKVDAPTETRALGGDLERGVSNGQGWWYQGFIEDAAGELRPQTFEETTFCVGCHGGIGRTDDGVFSFGRRFGSDTFQRGWFHWSQKGLEGVPDQPAYGGAGTEYVTYLEENGAADEFRQNDEAKAKFFDDRGALRPHMRERLRQDVSELLLPSPPRAVALDKAYRALVRTQRFREGRDVLLGGAEQVHRVLPPDEKTRIERAVAPAWGKSRFSARALEQ